MVTMYTEKQNDQIKATSAGIFLLSLSVLGQTGQMILEEKITRIDTRLDPPQLVGMEGAWGFLVFIPIVLLVNGVNCTENTVNPELLECENGKIDDFGYAMDQMRANPRLMWLNLAYLFLIVIASQCGVYIIKYANAMERVTIGHTRIAFVWLFFIFYQGDGHQDFNWLQFVFMTLLIVSTLMFVVYDRQISDNEGEDELDEQSGTYISSQTRGPRTQNLSELLDSDDIQEEEKTGLLSNDSE